MSILTIKNEQTSEANYLVKDTKLSLCVLAVDDQPICRAILEKLIEAQGVAVETAQDGEEALALWKIKHHSLIITDCHMPKMDGYMLAKAIRDNEQVDNANRTTIVALTANTLKEEKYRFSQTGIDSLLTKPIDTAQIKTLLSNWKSLASTNQNHKNSIIDYTVLSQIFPDTKKQNEILEGFQTHIQSDYLQLQEHTQKDNLPGVESTAHRMKGSCKMVGVNGIASLCEAIEKDAKSNVIAKDISLSALNESIREFTTFISLEEPRHIEFGTANICLKDGA